MIVPALFLVWWWDQRDWRVALKWFGLAVAGRGGLRAAVDGPQLRADGRVRPALDQHRRQPLHGPQAHGHRRRSTSSPSATRCRTRTACSSARPPSCATTRADPPGAAVHQATTPAGSRGWSGGASTSCTSATATTTASLIAEDFRYEEPWLSRGRATAVPGRRHQLLDRGRWARVGLVRLVLSRRGEAWALVVSIVGTASCRSGLFGDSRFKVPGHGAAGRRRSCAVRRPRWPGVGRAIFVAERAPRADVRAGEHRRSRRARCRTGAP